METLAMKHNKTIDRTGRAVVVFFFNSWAAIRSFKRYTYIFYMLRYSIIPILFFALALQNVHAGSSDNVMLIRAEYDGKMMEYSIPGKRVEKLPKWNHSQPIIPLPVHTATSKALAWMKIRNPKIESFEPYRIELVKVQSTGINDLWYYTVSFSGNVGGQRMFGGGLQAIVLMDGSIVEPAVRKNESECSAKC
jgi:hypothetical protein